MLKRIAWSLIPLLLVLFGADFALWQVAENRLDAGWARLLHSAEKKGWRITAAAPEHGGFPFAARLILPAFRAEGGNRLLPGGLAFGADRVRVELSFRHPLTLTVDAEDEQRLRAAFAPEFAYRARQMQAIVPLAWGKPVEEARLHGEDIRSVSSNGEGFMLERLALRATWPPASAQPATPPAVALMLHAEGIALPHRWRAPFGRAITRLDGEAVGEEQKDRGVLRVHGVALDWGALSLTGEGTLGLDATGEPEGEGVVHIVRPERALNALVESGTLGRRAGVALNALLVLLVRTPSDGGPTQVDVPVSLKQQMLSVGEIPVWRVPKWKGSALP